MSNSMVSFSRNTVTYKYETKLVLYLFPSQIYNKEKKRKKNGPRRR